MGQYGFPIIKYLYNFFQRVSPEYIFYSPEFLNSQSLNLFTFLQIYPFILYIFFPNKTIYSGGGPTPLPLPPGGAQAEGHRKILIIDNQL